MQKPEHVEGDAVYLRPVLPEEATSILAGRPPPHLSFAEGYPGRSSLEVMDIFVGKRRGESPGFTPLFIVRRADNAVVGEIGWSTPDGPEAPVVGYDVVESVRGRGCATDALRALIGYLFTLPQVTRVLADAQKTHIASRRVMEKAGMRLVREACEEVDGEMQDVLYYETERAAQ